MTERYVATLSNYKYIYSTISMVKRWYCRIFSPWITLQFHHFTVNLNELLTVCFLKIIKQYHSLSKLNNRTLITLTFNISFKQLDWNWNTCFCKSKIAFRLASSWWGQELLFVAMIEQTSNRSLIEGVCWRWIREITWQFLEFKSMLYIWNNLYIKRYTEQSHSYKRLNWL